MCLLLSCRKPVLRGKADGQYVENAGKTGMTVEEADRLYPDDRIEVIDGEVFMTAAPPVRHQEMKESVKATFNRFFKDKTCKPYMEIGVRLDKEKRVIPDVLVVCNPDKVDDKGVNGSPDLVVEVLSLGTKNYDMGKKQILYKESGVSEYWVIDPDRGTGVIWVWDKEKVEAGVDEVAIVAGRIESVIFPGLIVDISRTENL